MMRCMAMIQSMMRRAAAVAVVLAWCGGASAESRPDTVARWGLLGTWTIDCAKGPSRENAHDTYVRRGTNVFLERNGGDYQDSNRLLDASISPDGLLQLRIEFKKFSQTRAISTVKGPDGRIRVLTNHDTKGSYSVKNGKFVSNDSPTLCMTRCR